MLGGRRQSTGRKVAVLGKRSIPISVCVSKTYCGVSLFLLVGSVQYIREADVKEVNLEE